MQFVYPQFFWVMIVPFAIFVFLVLFAAVFLMIVALSRPVIEKGEKVVNLKGISAVIALDISGSMRSTDLYPNRLEFAKKKLMEMLDAMPSDEIALTAFAHNAFVLAPFTGDKATLKQIVEGVNESYINMASTDFSAMAELAGRLLEKRKEKVLIVFTDGGDTESLKGLSTILKEKGITLYAVLVGTQKGAPVLDRQGRPLKLRNGSLAITQLNEALGKIARQSGGEYLIAGYGKSDMKWLAQRIHGKFTGKSRGTIHIKERVELFPYPLIAAALLLLMGLSSMPRAGEGFRRRRRRSAK